MKFSYYLILVIFGVRSCLANQDLKSLEDEELKDFVLESETGAFKESPLKYWTINNMDKGKKRLDVRFLPNSFYKEEHVVGMEFDRWCRDQLQLAFSKEHLPLMIGGLCKGASPADITNSASFVESLTSDVAESLRIRAASVIVCTSRSISELRESLCLLLLLIALDEASDTNSSPGFYALVQCMQTNSETAVLAQLVVLSIKLSEAEEEKTNAISRCFEHLRYGKFNVPFVLEKGDDQRVRTLSIDMEFPSLVAKRMVQHNSTVKTTEFEILEDFRWESSGVLLARSLRRSFFAKLIEGIRLHLSSMNADERHTYFKLHRKDLELVCARMSKCDSLTEFLLARSYYCSFLREEKLDLDDDPTFQSDAWKKASDLVDSHVRIPPFAAGRRTTNLYRLCQAMLAIGDNWENRLVVPQE